MKFIALLLATLLFHAGVFAADDAKKDADNSRKNERDRAGDTKTPIDQSNDPADLKITKDIRQAIVKDKSLSTAAKNIKVITTKGGNVTLRGPVDNAGEKESIVKVAKAAAGVQKVDDQLEVKTK